MGLPGTYAFTAIRLLLLMGFKLMAGAVASCALIGVAVGVGIIYGSLLISIGRNPSQRDELLRYAFIGFSLVEVSGLIGLVISLLLLFGFDGLGCSTEVTLKFILICRLSNEDQGTCHCSC